MRKIIILCLLGIIAACQDRPAQKEPTSAPTSTQTIRKGCDDCNFEIVDQLASSSTLSPKELEQFLCLFRPECEWPDILLEIDSNFYSGPAWDLLFINFDEHFVLYTQAFDSELDLDYHYLQRLFAQPALYDLPHRSIASKLDALEHPSSKILAISKSIHTGVVAGDSIFALNPGESPD